MTYPSQTKEASRERMRKHREKHKRKTRRQSRESMRRYREKNPGVSAFEKAIRRARELGRLPAWADLKRIRMFYTRAALAGMVVDHIIAYADPECSGLMVHENLQVISKCMNELKGNRRVSLAEMRRICEGTI